MHLLPIILATWSFRQETTDKFLRSLSGTSPKRFEHAEIPKLAVSSTGTLTIRSGESGLMAPSEVEAIRNRSRDFSAGPPRANPDGSNTIIGSHFASNEITHYGTDAWDSLKNRLAENGVLIDDDRVAELSAGFFAERKLQEILGRSDRGRLRDELMSDLLDDDGKMLSNARWVREIQALPDEEEIAAECFADLQKNFPQAIGSDVEATNRAIGYDQNVLEIE